MINTHVLSRYVVISRTSVSHLAIFIVSLFLLMPLLGIATSGVNDYPEGLESLSEVSYTHSSSSMNEPGFQEGSIFSESTLALGGWSDQLTCGIFNHSVYCVGNTNYGQLGYTSGNSNEYNVTPQKIDLGPSAVVTSVTAGYAHACAILDNSSLYCWGRNNYGQLGDGWDGNWSTQPTQSHVPVEVILPPGRVPIEVSAFGYHTCSILDNASVYCWGRNTNGQLGRGYEGFDNYAQWTPQPMLLPEGRGAIAVSLGSFTTCVILDDKSLNCVGDLHGNGVVNPDYSTYLDLNPIFGLPNDKYVVAVSPGWDHTCTLMNDGTVYCWGQNNWLGSGINYSWYDNGNFNTSSIATPQQVNFGNEAFITSINVGFSSACAIVDNGSVMCWGGGNFGDGLDYYRDDVNQTSNIPTVPVAVTTLPQNSKSISVMVGDGSACSILENSSVYCWGNNGAGQLGTGSNTPLYATSALYSNLGLGQDLGLSERDFDGDGILNIFDTHMRGGQSGSIFVRSLLDASESEGASTCAISESSELYCWGMNGNGQLGIGNVTDQNTPQLVDFGGNFSAMSVDAGSVHTCAILGDSSLKCWGGNAYGQLGIGNNTDQYTPMQVGGINTLFAGITVGTLHTCAILGNGALKCWGYNGFGQLGYQSGGSQDWANTPVLVNLSSNSAIAVSAGYMHTCAILDDGTLKCWGLNGYGQLGDGSTSTQQYTPTSISLGNHTAVAISTGEYHTCAILDDGSLSCWGKNTWGQLGNGNTNQQNSPVNVNLGSGRTALAVSAASEYTCALLDTGSIKCWGRNNFGQIGNGGALTAHYSSPQDVSLGINDTAIAISAGHQHSCAILDSGLLKCWGSGSYGRLGTGYTTAQSTPVNVNLPANEFLATGDVDNDGDGIMDIFDHFPNNPIRSINCPAGSYGRYSCVETTPGHYAPAASMYQTECDSGTYQPNTNQSSCISSSPGHYVPNPGSISQMQCSAGTYNTNNGSTSLSDCILSSPGYYAAGTLLEDGFESGDLYGLFDNWSGDIDFAHCSNENECYDRWAVSNYSPLAGNYSLSIGSPYGNLANGLLKVVSVSINLSHEANFTFSYRVSSEAWDKLTFCLDAVNYTCGAADQNYFTGSNQEGGVGPTDYYIRAWSGTGGANSSAQSGNFSIILSAGNHTLHWAYSKDSSVGDLDDSAWLDNFSITTPLGSISQTECSPGTYQNLSGQISCNDADPGYFVLNSASTIQSECLQGNYQPLSGQSSCLNASAGYYVTNSGSTNQTACPPGTYNPYIASINSTSCINTSPGYFAANAGSANQTACVPGTFQSNYNQTECIDSSPGFYVSNSGSANQTACSVGTYQPGTNQTNCIDSSPGYYVPNIGSSNQLICNSGTYQPNYGQSSCIDSSPGYYVSNSGQTTQSACLEGTYQPNYNQSGCIDSSPGYYVDNTAMSNQTACPGGTFNPNYGSISSNDCITTSSGYFASSGSGSQNPCQSGTYQPLTGQTNCTSTDPGYYVPGLSYVLQLSCNPGTYQPNSGSSDCLIADAGYYVDSYSSDTQTACPAGTFNPVNGSSSYSSCIDTGPGYFTPISGMSEEYPCNPGTYQPLGGQDNCTNSSPGYFVPMNASTTQEPCSLGYYQPYSGQSECIEADSGFYVDDNGSTTQIPCIGGTYNPNNGSISIDSCIDSIPGHYSKDGYSIYTPCDLGFYQPSSGQSRCIEADPGFYVENNGSIDQIPCVEGTYNPNFVADSQDHCVQSNPGYHVPSPGSANQIPCIKGTYQPNFGESNCIPASLGYYVPVEGSISQIAADLDYYVDYTGSFTTSQCPEFYLTLETGSKTIDECLLDTDLDRNANIFDEDDDNDNILDVNDFCPAGQIDWISGFVNDQDIDGCKDSGEDLDDDNDGRLDENDAFPYDSFEQDDNDLDGQGDNLDIDDDNDGLSDILEYDLGTNQFDADTDGDGFNDKIDHFPLDGNEWVDTDGDGVGDNSDFMIELARYQSKLDVTIDLIAVIIIILSLTVLYRKKTSESGPPPPPSKKPKKKLDSPPLPPSKKPKKKLDSPPLPPSKKPKKKLESPSPPKSKNNN